jgi:protein-tyrosine phosphatase
MNKTQLTRHLPTQGLYNLRELGGYTTQTGQSTQWRKIMRADGLHRLESAAQEDLLALGVKTVIDLRNPEELTQSPNVFANHHQVKYLNVSLFAGLARAAQSELNSTPNNLINIYQQALKHSQDEFRTVLKEIASSDEGTTLFHCTAGKDRTGLIAALVLGALGVSEEQIVQDYALTSDYIEPLLEPLRQEAVAKGYDLAWYNQLLTSEAPTMEHTLAHLKDQYGGIEGYWKTLGLEAELKQLRLKMLK